jgi:hypothetical protein
LKCDISTAQNVWKCKVGYLGVSQNFWFRERQNVGMFPKTNSMDQIFSAEVNNRSSSQDIPYLLWYLNVPHCVTGPSLEQGESNPHPPILFKLHFNIILLSTHVASTWCLPFKLSDLNFMWALKLYIKIAVFWM